MKKFENKVAVITGGNSGIGYAAAREFVAQGAKVIVTGRRKEAIEQAAVEMGAFPFVADQASLADTEALCKAFSSNSVRSIYSLSTQGLSAAADR
jgi:NAD(P)-dependent dehydrogenase (short-subunit alcohol dehydrogenase family)